MIDENEIVLTPGGHDKLKQRLDYLRNVQRPDIAQRLRDSKHSGELAENAEYDNAKQEQALIESEILELAHLLQIARVIDHDSIPTEYIGIGSIVKMTNLENNAEWEFTLVGSAEADPDSDLISDASPIGQALVGAKVGETTSIRVPRGTVRYRIETIRK